MKNPILRAKLEKMTEWSEIINLAKYPIHKPKSDEFQELLRTCKASMAKTGACELPNFVSDAAVKLLQEECETLGRKAFFKPVNGNAYLAPGNSDLPKDHPLNLTETTNVGVVAYDQFPQISLLKRIYEYPQLMAFVGQILDLKAIYQYGDPMGALNLSVMNESDYLRWHFDQTDFVTSLAIQSGEKGGNFEYVPMIRTPSEENYIEVQKLLKGDRSRVIHLDNIPGTLVLFQGRYSIHRVTPIEGKRPRWIGLFGYDSKPGVMSTPHLREMRYGRQEVIEHRPEF